MYRVYVYDQNNNELENHLFSNFDTCDSYIRDMRSLGFFCSVVDVCDGYIIAW